MGIVKYGPVKSSSTGQIVRPYQPPQSSVGAWGSTNMGPTYFKQATPSTSNPLPQGGGVGTGGSASTSTVGGNQDYGAINRQVDVGNQGIDQDYTNYINELDAQSGDIQNQGNTAVQSLQDQSASVKNQLVQQRDTSISGLQSQQQTAEKTTKSSLQQARDLYKQMTQQNIAQLSGSGLSSSSVAEALSERLGVETARRIAGITGSLDEVRQNVSKEVTRVNSYFQQKVTELESTLATNMKSVQDQLLSQLNQINRAKQVASTQKAQSRSQLLLSAQNAISTMKMQAQQYAQSLETWKAQISQGLASAPDFLTKQNDLVAKLQTNPAYQGQTITPSLNLNSQGNVSGGRIDFSKTKADSFEEFLKTAAAS